MGEWWSPPRHPLPPFVQPPGFVPPPPEFILPRPEIIPPPFPPEYQMVRLLGQGSFGKVYEAYCVRDNRAVAIKVIDMPPMAASATLQRTLREVEAMYRLIDHPNICRLYQATTTHFKIYLVMELARGGDLQSELDRRGRLSERAARHYFKQLVCALRICHQRGVFHRDVKPQNILLDEHKNVKLSDFGIAFPAAAGHEASYLHTVCGTPGFTAPEVLSGRRGEGYDGAKADAWSCGVVLFMLLVGNLPPDVNELPNMLHTIPADVSYQTRSIIALLLDRDPATRMSIEALVENGLA